MKRAALLASALWALWVRAAFAAAGSAGEDPLSFLFLDADARPVSLGGAYTALAKDANALLYNPGGLGAVERNEATLMHNEYLAGVTQEYIAYASPRGWGLNLNYLNSGQVPRTTVSNPDGTGLANASFSDLAVGAGYGERVTKGLSLGAAVKFIRESNAGIAGQAYAFDIGAMVAPAALKGLSLGLAVQNIGPAIRFQSVREPLPLAARAGAAYAFALRGQESRLSFDVTKERSDSVVMGFGAETVVARTLPLRLGFSTRNSAGPGVTAGVGWIFRSFEVAYAFVPFGDLGAAHRISASFNWAGPERARARSEPPRGGGAPPPEAKAAAPAGADADEHFARAGRLIGAGSYDAARKELDEAKALLQDDDERQVLYLERMGVVALLGGDRKKAKQLFLDAIRLAVNNKVWTTAAADAYFGAGLCLEGEKKEAYAVRFFKRALEIGPSRMTQRHLNAELRKLHASGEE